MIQIMRLNFFLNVSLRIISFLFMEKKGIKDRIGCAPVGQATMLNK